MCFVKGLANYIKYVPNIRVVKELEGDITPSPNSFSMAFYHHCWRVDERDVLAVFEEFYQHSKFEKSFNATFIALIPGKNDACRHRILYPLRLGPLFSNDAQTLGPKANLEPNHIKLI